MALGDAIHPECGSIAKLVIIPARNLLERLAEGFGLGDRSTPVPALFTP